MMHALPVLPQNSKPLGSDSPLAGAPSSTFLLDLLAEQASLSAVDMFAQDHDDGQFARSAVYRNLMPATPPQPGQQYAFEVDLDRCSGCKACVSACHSLNGLDESEAWREVGLLVGGSTAAPIVQHVTAACHHCVEPACLIGCPVNAYEKDPKTGIVKHLDDQCFGCQYCTLACPYEVPRYHKAKGIVRKCDMCSTRLAVGQAPACVQSCPHQAIAIKVVDVAQILEDAETAQFLPAAPDPHITLPSTTYKTKRPFPRNLLPVDYFRVGVQHAHWPLVVMLVLTQLSVGAFWIGLLLDRTLPPQQAEALRPLLSANALGFGLLALAASVFHLGRPQFAYRAILGLGHSWLSREIVAFGLFAGLATAYAGGSWFAQGESQIWLRRVLEQAVALSGAVALFCSAMIYVFTQRELWSLRRVLVRFVLTAILLGIAAVWLSALVLNVVKPSPELSSLIATTGPQLCQALMATAALKLLWEAALLRNLYSRRMTVFKRSAKLMVTECANLTIARFAAGLLGGVVMPAMLLVGLSSAGISDTVRFTAITGMLFVFCLVGELLERILFFTACATPRMPGAMR
jgi:Fe-S-cluster-containing dehydrogenase component/DMSO reductase anchor subunit